MEVLMPRKVVARRAAGQKSDPWDKLKDNWLLRGRGKAPKEGWNSRISGLCPLKESWHWLWGEDSCTSLVSD